MAEITDYSSPSPFARRRRALDVPGFRPDYPSGPEHIVHRHNHGHSQVFHTPGNFPAPDPYLSARPGEAAPVHHGYERDSGEYMRPSRHPHHTYRPHQDLRYPRHPITAPTLIPHTLWRHIRIPTNITPLKTQGRMLDFTEVQILEILAEHDSVRFLNCVRVRVLVVVVI